MTTTKGRIKSLSSQITWLSVAFAVGLLCCVVVFAWWGVMRIDDRSLARQIRSVEIGLAEAIADMPVEQDSSAIWDDAVVNLRANNEAWLAENLVEWMSEYYRHDYVYVLDRHNVPMRGASSGEKLEANSFEVFRRAIQPLVLQLRADMAAVSDDPEDSTSAITGLGIADFVTLPDQSVAVVSIRPVVPSSGAIKQVPGEEYLHVSIKTIAEAFTRPIAERFSLRELQFVTALPNSDRAWVAMRDRSYSLIGYMIWSPDRPASALVLDLLPAAGLSFAVGVTGLVLLLRRLRRTSAKLEVSEAQAQYLAFHDPLCGIPNRALFEDRLDQALAMMRRTKGKVALHFLDLDGFKHLNDTLGHAAGDELLCQVSERLRFVIRETDTLARLGGDEFAIIQVDVAEQLGAERLAERIIASMSKPFRLSGGEGRVGVSIGIVLTSEPDCAAADLRRKADIALYQAKANGRGRLQVFIGDMDDAVRQKQALERDLRLAFFGKMAELSDRRTFLRHLSPVRKKRWVVYAGPPFAGPHAVLAYLSRYTHRVPISNSRLMQFDEAGVTFRYKDYRHAGADRQQVMTLATHEFIRRFLIHVLPRGFHCIRHYGLLAGSARKDCLAQARDLLEVAPAPEEPAAEEPADPRPPCPCCGGTMVIIESFAPWCQPRAPPAAPASNRENAHDPA